jgi:hypothetical protein
MKPSFINLIAFLCSVFFTFSTFAQSATAQLHPLIGAFYFGGWWENPPAHFAPEIKLPTPVKDWRIPFPEREPVTGWYDDKQAIMDKQIELASDGGINFFAFDWYPPSAVAEHNYPGSNANLNNGLRFFMASPQNHKMSFMLVYNNQPPFAFSTPQEWANACNYWITVFKHPRYLKVNGKPVFFLLSVSELRKAMGGSSGVKAALTQLRNAAKAEGFPGVEIIGALPGPGPHNTTAINFAKDGYDAYSAYNFPLSQRNNAGAMPYPEMIEKESGIWQSFDSSPIPLIPYLTSSWDRRATRGTDDKDSIWLTEHTPEAFREFLALAKQYMEKPARAHLEVKNLLFLYAWNEIGEGGILIPTKQDGDSYLKQIREVFGTQKQRSETRP